MKSRILLTLFAILLCVTGCGTPSHLHQGSVVGKSYDDADSWDEYIPRTCIEETEYNNGISTEYPVCSGGYWQHYHDPPHWYLQIRGTYVTKKGVEKQVSEWHEVDQYSYDDTKVGEQWQG